MGEEERTRNGRKMEGRGYWEKERKRRERKMSIGREEEIIVMYNSII